MKNKSLETQFVFCIENSGCEDLEKHKLSQVLPDAKRKQEGYRYVIDESEEDYLYQAFYFIFLELPLKVQEAPAATNQVFCPQISGKTLLLNF